jgi:hypothetical protein
MFRFLCHKLGTTENSQIQADYREVVGHTKTKDRTCRSASCRAQEAVCNWLFASPHCAPESSCRAAGPGSPLALVAGDATFSAFWLWEGLSGQGACLTLSLLETTWR